jgi:hypothetical protein
LKQTITHSGPDVDDDLYELQSAQRQLQYEVDRANTEVELSRVECEEYEVLLLDIKRRNKEAELHAMVRFLNTVVKFSSLLSVIIPSAASHLFVPATFLHMYCSCSKRLCCCKSKKMPRNNAMQRY